MDRFEILVENVRNERTFEKTDTYRGTVFRVDNDGHKCVDDIVEFDVPRSFGWIANYLNGTYDSEEVTFTNEGVDFGRAKTIKSKLAKVVEFLKK